MRLIDADELKKKFKSAHIGNVPRCIFNSRDLGYINQVIDNAPTVEERPQGEWYEHIDKGLLKARHGDYVLYKVDYLLDNLAREVNIMESARRMKGGAE